MAVRSGPQAEPLAVPPIDEVVLAAFPRTRPVGDLVVLVAGPSERTLCGAVQPRDALVVGLRDGGLLPPAQHAPPARTGPVRDGLLRLEHQLERIARDVIRREADRVGQIAHPVIARLIWPSKNEVEAHVEAQGADRVDRGGRVLWLVRAPQRAKSLRTERLRAQRDARDARGTPGQKARAVERRRIRFDRRLDQRKVERVAQRGRNGADLLGLEEARRPAAEVQRPCRGPVERCALAPDLAHQRIDVARAQLRGGGGGREVAVRTARRAEGDVDVQGDAHLRIAPSGSGSSASTERSAVFPRSSSHSRDSWTNASRWLGFHSASLTTRSSPNSGRRRT